MEKVIEYLKLRVNGHASKHVLTPDEAQTIIDYYEQHQWKVVEKDGNPKEYDLYFISFKYPSGEIGFSISHYLAGNKWGGDSWGSCIIAWLKIPEFKEK